MVRGNPVLMPAQSITLRDFFDRAFQCSPECSDTSVCPMCRLDTHVDIDLDEARHRGLKERINSIKHGVVALCLESFCETCGAAFQRD